mmetsp:Transcript_19063/g.44534  ORF Transcript_19063/g.44534 Transcript_19063/m.44534 type:complete len:267 (+) Transcript_19063:1443-2243(+)
MLSRVTNCIKVSMVTGKDRNHKATCSWNSGSASGPTAKLCLVMISIDMVLAMYSISIKSIHVHKTVVMQFCSPFASIAKVRNRTKMWNTRAIRIIRSNLNVITTAVPLSARPLTRGPTQLKTTPAVTSKASNSHQPLRAAARPIATALTMSSSTNKIRNTCSISVSAFGTALSPYSTLHCCSMPINAALAAIIKHISASNLHDKMYNFNLSESDGSSSSPRLEKEALSFLPSADPEDPDPKWNRACKWCALCDLFSLGAGLFFDLS